MITGVAHTAVCVPDVAAATRWYESVLGLQVLSPPYRMEGDAITRDMQIDIELFARGGLAILRKIEDIGYNVWRTRPALAKWEKAALVGGALWRRLRGRRRPLANRVPSVGM